MLCKLFFPSREGLFLFNLEYMFYLNLSCKLVLPTDWRKNGLFEYLALGSVPLTHRKQLGSISTTVGSNPQAHSEFWFSGITEWIVSMPSDLFIKTIYILHEALGLCLLESGPIHPLLSSTSDMAKPLVKLSRVSKQFATCHEDMLLKR